MKYGRLLKPGEDPGDVVWREKQREDRMRDLGYEVGRLIWSDLSDRPAIAERFRGIRSSTQAAGGSHLAVPPGTAHPAARRPNFTRIADRSPGSGAW